MGVLPHVKIVRPSPSFTEMLLRLLSPESGMPHRAWIHFGPGLHVARIKQRSVGSLERKRLLKYSQTYEFE
jgi:hypothetical protein